MLVYAWKRMLHDSHRYATIVTQQHRCSVLQTNMSSCRAVCVTCGSQYGSTDSPERCIICDEERQFIGHDGQQWTTAAELQKGHKNTWEELESGLYAIGVEPKFGIGQRCYLITTGKPA